MPASLLDARVGRGQAFGDDVVDRWVEGKSQVGTTHAEISVAVVCRATTPVHDSIIFSVDRGLQNRLWYAASSRFQEVTGAAPRITIRQDRVAVLFDDAHTDFFGYAQNTAMGGHLPQWSAERDHGCNIFRTLGSNGTSDCASEAVPDQMNFAASILKSRVDALCQILLDQEIWTLCVDADARR